MRATAVGADTALGRIIELVERAQNSKAPGPATGRPRRRGARDRRAVLRAPHVRRLDGVLRRGPPHRPDVRHQRRGHRLPGRARPRDPDRRGRRHRPRRQARHPHQGRRDAGGDRRPRCDRPGQDRDVDDRPARAHRGGVDRRSSRAGPARARRERGAVIRASARRCDRPRRGGSQHHLGRTRGLRGGGRPRPRRDDRRAARGRGEPPHDGAGGRDGRWPRPPRRGTRGPRQHGHVRGDRRQARWARRRRRPGAPERGERRSWRSAAPGSRWP